LENELIFRIRTFCQLGIEKQPSNREKTVCTDMSIGAWNDDDDDDDDDDDNDDDDTKL